MGETEKDLKSIQNEFSEWINVIHINKFNTWDLKRCEIKFDNGDTCY